MGWFTKGAEAGLPLTMYNLGVMLDAEEGVAAPDYPAAADCFRRAADAGHVEAANNLSNMYQVDRGRAWHNMSASSSFYTLVPWVDWHHLTWRATYAGPKARRHAEQAAGDDVETQGRRER
jgi:TPR repeat protein